MYLLLLDFGFFRILPVSIAGILDEKKLLIISYKERGE